MHQQQLLRNCAKALGLTILSDGTPGELWVRDKVPESQSLFNPLTNRTLTAEMIAQLHLELQWSRKTKRWMVRARVHGTQWRNDAWHKTLAEAVVHCVGHYHAGEFERL